jgi:CheY-like chemotaxis protein
MTILVVDDEPEYRLIMRSVLTGEGYDVAVAENGEEALRKLQEMPVDMVISDIYMPVMDGIKFNRAARALPKYEKVPFLFVSAFDDQHTLEAVRDPRYDGFLRKARPVEEMMEWITYLTTPAADRPKVPPGGRKPKPGETVHGSRSSGLS